GLFSQAPGSPISTPQLVAQLPTQPYALIAGDFNKDGKTDLAITVLATTVPDGPPLTNALVATYLGNGDGTFATPSTITLLTSATKVVAADINQDGNLDFAILQGASVTIYSGDGHGGFSSGASVAPNDATDSDFALLDYNGDGILDIAV